MDGVLERIDEDEEQKTDQSAITDGDEAEGATAEMRTASKEDGYEAINNAPEVTIGDGIMASAGPAHELDSNDESLQQTAHALVDRQLMEGEGIQAQPFLEEASGSMEKTHTRKSKEKITKQRK